MKRVFHRLRCSLLFLAFFVSCGLKSTLDASPPTQDSSDVDAPVDFDRDVRPILSDKCFACHGPDAARRKADLRLDTPHRPDRTSTDERLFTPGEPETSLLFRRVTATDKNERMPPPDSGQHLAPRELETLRRWIAQGAPWQGHWAFRGPRRARLPGVRDTSWPRRPFDYFVLERLEQESLHPSPPAEPLSLLRRVTLDLTGLPPTPAETAAFLADTVPGAYERTVDRLLASPRYGERMASRWLDAARYADTSGYQTDGPRQMWRWRDWVIEAFNRNLPFDVFTVEQLAGDLLPDPTLDQLIATGFNRNHRGNAEGGIIPEEYRVEYVVDRVDTTATVWLGLTLGCARCHDHKYDPFTQKEFYQVFAYFNNVDERGKAFKIGNSAPFISAPTQEQRERLAERVRQRDRAATRWQQLQPVVQQRQEAWERAFRSSDPVQPPEDRPIVSRELVVRYPLDDETREGLRRATAVDKGPEAGETVGDRANNGRSKEDSPARTEDRRPVKERRLADGRRTTGARLDGSDFIEVGDVGNFTYFDSFSISAWVFPEENSSGGIVSRMEDTFDSRGYSVHFRDGKVQFTLVKRWLDDSLRVESRRSIPTNEWHHVLVTYDGSRTADGIRIYLDGVSSPLRYVVNDLNQDFASVAPLRIGARGTQERLRGVVDEVRIYKAALKPHEATILATRDPIHTILARPPQERSQSQGKKLTAYFIESGAAPKLRATRLELERLEAELTTLRRQLPTTMIMQERAERRPTFVLQRGEYDKPGEAVTPGVPASLPGLPDEAPRNRLGFARWLMDASNPLTARVVVNRYWQMVFGRGLVATVEDFGAQGERPSHPRLLDALAVEFRESGWDVKHLLRQIVTSATYRQSSRISPKLLARDPTNRLLGRGPRFRLAAQIIRDQALAVSGLLVGTISGPSVKPYQPAGLWQEVSADKYEPGVGRDLYRRSLYTFWKRTVAPPSMMAFDASPREMCTVRQTRTNTPLQALTLMNDVTYVEAGRALAERALAQARPTAVKRVTLAFRLATGRPPSRDELKVLLEGLREHLVRYAKDTTAARSLVETGASPGTTTVPAAELAAYTVVACMILNLDETVTKE